MQNYKTKRQLALLDKFLGVHRRYSHVAIALFGNCLISLDEFKHRSQQTSTHVVRVSGCVD